MLCPRGLPRRYFHQEASRQWYLCPADHLPLYLQTQPVCDLADLVDIGEQLIMTDEVPVDDRDGGWKEMRAALA